MSRLLAVSTAVSVCLSCAPEPVIPPPAAPRGVVASAADGALLVRWDAVADATSYDLYWATAAGVTTAGTKVAGVTSPATVSGLSNRTTYYVVVTATGAGGESVLSAEVSATPRAIPAAPANLAVTRGDASATLTWDAVEDADAYDLYFGDMPAASLQAKTRIAGVSSPFTHFGLRNGLPLHWVVVARNTAGEGPPSAEVTATPRGRPLAPANVVATRGDRRVSLAWDPVDGAQRYFVYVSSLDGVTKLTGDKRDAATTGFEESELTNGVTRYYVVTAENEAGEGEASAQVSATPLVAPAPPADLVATRGNGEITFEWTRDALADFSTLTWSTDPDVAPGNGTTLVDVRSPYVLRGLVNGTAVHAIVYDTNDAGTGLPSAVVEATPLRAPDAPSTPVAVRGDRAVTLTWDAVPLAERYDLLWSAGAVVTSSATRITNVTSPAVVDGLVNGTRYAFAVIAANSAGEGPRSESVDAVPLVAPARVTGLVATRGESRITLEWPAVDLADAYDLYARPTLSAAPGLGAKLEDVRSPYVDLDLPNGVSRTYVVVARNDAGAAPPSDEASATPLARPAAPANVAATASDGSIEIRWDAVAGADTYDIYWSDSSGVTRSTGTRITHATSPHALATPNGTTRFFIVSATNASGEGEASGQVSATPWPVLNAPAGLVATAGPTLVTLDWNDVAHADSYAVYWTTGATVSKSSATRIGLVSKPFAHAGLVDGTTYRYAVAAVHGGGEGPLSATASATPRSPPPVPVNVVATPGARTIRLTWDAVPTATEYRVFVSRNPMIESVGPVRSTTATQAEFTELIEDQGPTWFAVSAVNAAGESGRSRTTCARLTPWDNSGLVLFDTLCGASLDNRKWQFPQYGRGVINGRMILAAVADNMQARNAQGFTYQNMANVQAGASRVTSIQAKVNAASNYSYARHGGQVVAAVRLGYQPAANRGLLVPAANMNMLIGNVDLIDPGDGTGLHLRRSFVHCDNQECSRFSNSGFVATDPPAFVVTPAVPAQALAPAMYDTDYVIRVSFDEATNTFHWSAQGGTYTTPVTGSVDVSAWLATPGLGMVMNTTTSGFLFAQLGSRVFDGTPTGGGSGSMFAYFDDVEVGFNGQPPTLYDDFATMGSTDQAGPSVAKWGPNDTAAFLEHDSLFVRATHVTPGNFGGNTFGALPMMFPVSYNTIAFETQILHDESTAPFVFRGVNVLGHYYNDGTGSGRVGDATGDVRAQLFLAPTGASFSISRCTNANCTLGSGHTSSPSNVLPASPSNPISVGSRHRVLQKWDPVAHTFTFQLDDMPAVVVDPTNPADPYMTGGAIPMVRPTPGYPSRSFGVRTGAHGGATTGMRSNFEAAVWNVFVAP